MESNSSSHPPTETPQTIDTSSTEDASSRKRAREISSAKPPVVPKKRSSPYWEHCEKATRKATDGSTQQIGICKYCKSEIPANLGSTSGLKNHLVKRCKLSPLYEVTASEKGQSILSNETMGQTSQVVPHYFNQKRCELKITQYVIIDETSFRAVEGRGFVALIHELQPKFRIPDRKRVAGMVYTLYLAEKSKLQSVISGQRVSITTDTWTSIQNINYMVITAHFLDSDWKLHKRIINFTKITSHVGEEIGKLIEGCLREWGIEKVFTIVVDNASSNDTAIDYLKKRMRIDGNLLFDGKYLHLRCACHILNLIVKDGLKELSVAVKSIRNAVVFLHSSPARLDKFREYAVLAKFCSTSTVPMDVKTRWNSTYKMLAIALNYRRVFERMADEWLPFVSYFGEENEKGKRRIGPPIEEDWENAKAFVHFLQKFYDATLQLSATKTPTSQLIYQSMLAIQIEIEKRCNDASDITLKTVASSMKAKFDKYWGNYNSMNPLIFIANVLDPRSKLVMMKVGATTFGGDAKKLQEFIDRVKNDLVTLWSEYKGVNDTLSNENLNMNLDCGEAEGAGKEGAGLCDELFANVAAQIEKDQLQQICNEVDKYLADDIEKRSNTFNLLNWWKGCESKYPILSCIAKDIFAIPSSTVASESAFSLGKRVVDPFRTSLSPKMVEALVCTNDWLKAEEFDVFKDPTDDDLQLYKEIEEIEKNANTTQDCSHNNSPSSSLSVI